MTGGKQANCKHAHCVEKLVAAGSVPQKHSLELKQTRAAVSKAGDGLQGTQRQTYYSTPATWKPCEKQKLVHMAYVMAASTFDGPLRSRPSTLSRIQVPSVDQPLGSIVWAERTGLVGWTGVVDAKGASVVKMERA